jgi:hypothetical protein
MAISPQGDPMEPTPTAGPVPARRRFLQYGGLGVAAAVLAACGKDTTKPGETGTTTTLDPSTTAPAAPQPAITPTARQTALQWLQTAISLELLIVKVYQDAGDQLADEVQATAQAFLQQHQAHVVTLQTAVEGAFSAKDVYQKPNSYLTDSLVTPTLQSLSGAAKAAKGDPGAIADSKAAYAKFFAQLETTAASTYLSATQTLFSPDLRHTMMGIAGPAARRAATYNVGLNATVPESGLFPTSYTIPNDGLVS